MSHLVINAWFVDSYSLVQYSWGEYTRCYTEANKVLKRPFTERPRAQQPLQPRVVAGPAQSAGQTGMMAAPRPVFYLTAAFVFVVYARFPEIVDIVTGHSLHSARIILVLALLSALLFGGAVRAVFSGVGICLLAFTAWLCICTPFSIWRGGSVRMLRDFWLLSLCSFVIVAASVQGLEQCRKIMGSLAAATVFIELFTFIIGRVQGGRVALLAGTLGNANYLAMMLLMGLPFCLFVVRTRPGAPLLKVVCVLMLFMIPVTVAATGSRGGLVTLVLMFLLYFLPLPANQKAVAAVAALILAAVAITWASRSALERYKTIFLSSDQPHLSSSEQSALDSTGLRKELLWSSLQLTLRHPLLGVGPGMFAEANANYTAETSGGSTWNAWHETHNTFTQLSCEDGLPGLFLYCLAMLGCFRIVLVAGKRARQNFTEPLVQHMAFALRLALVAFVGTSIFASNAYAYYFPILAGLCVALERAIPEQAPGLTLAGTQPPGATAQTARTAAAPRPKTAGGSRSLAWKRLP